MTIIRTLVVPYPSISATSGTVYQRRRSGPMGAFRSLVGPPLFCCAAVDMSDSSRRGLTSSRSRLTRNGDGSRCLWITTGTTCPPT